MAEPAPRRDPFDASWRERLAVLGGVFGVIAAAVVVGLVFAPTQTLELIGIIPASMFVVGKFLPLWSVSGKSHFGPYELGLVIWILDTLSSVFWVYAFEGLYRFRRLKRTIDRIQDSASLVLEAYPAMRRAAVIGLVLFVLFPVAGTGAMVGTFLGILLKLNRGVLIAAVSAGGLLGGMLMAVAADQFAAPLMRFQAMQSDPLIKYGSVAAVVAALGVAVWIGNRSYRRALEQAQARRRAIRAT